MPNKQLESSLAGCGITVLISCGGVGCIASAFSLPTDTVWRIALWAIATALSVFFCQKPRLRWLPVAVALALAAYFWFFGDLERSWELLLNRISDHFDTYYHWGVIRWTAGSLKGTSAASALCSIGVLLAMISAGCIFCGLPGSFASVAILTPLFLCILSIDAAPEPLWLSLLLAGMLLLLLTDLARQRGSAYWPRLTAILAIPVALAVILLLLAVPKKDFNGDNRLTEFADRLASRFSAMLEGNTTSLSGAQESNRVDLSQVGTLTTSRAIVMDLSGTPSGTVYLRGQSLDNYEGTGWSDSGRHSGLSWPDDSVLQDIGPLHIHTRRILPTVYFPYYADNTAPDQSNNRIPNEVGYTDYSFMLQKLVPEAAQNRVSTVPDTPCLQLPDSTRRWAEQLLEEILPEEELDPCRAAALIGNYVANSAQYSLRVDTMPALSGDFVRWFLETQEEGYCVHFASSAVVLLRAAKIPARYVTGYMAEMKTNTAVVRAEDAHAWAEYWVNGLGWMVLEATPALPASEAATVPSTTTPGTQPPVSTTAPTAPSSAPTNAPVKPQPTAPSPVLPHTPQKAGSLKPFLTWILSAATLLLLVLLQRKLRLFFFKTRLAKAAPNQKALLLWARSVRLARLLREPLPRALHASAQKARFSQHTLTPEELTPMEAYICDAQGKLRKKPWYLRLLYRYLLAAY